MADEQRIGPAQPGAEARLGAALRRCREERALSLRALARRLHRSHSTLVEYERGHRLAPLDVIEAYETELELPAGTLVALHEQARLQRYGEDRSHRQTYILKPVLEAPRQLPPDVANFTGREAELEELRSMVTDRIAGTMVISAIAGTAGVGKTALAVHLAHQLAPEFPDVHLYVNLHGYEPAQRLAPTEVLDRFLRALGVPADTLPAELEEQAARYRSLLAGRRALVVLDNAGTSEQVRPLLPASPTCLVIVTSRDRLGGLIAAEGAHLLILDRLEREEALELLSRTAGFKRVAAEPEVAEQVVQLCGYLPLAVRIAGARLATRPTMRLTALAQRLANERGRLAELSIGDVEVRSSFALSYQSLDGETARMFRRLGLVVGPEFGTGVAGVLSDISSKEAEVLLENLVDAHLLEATHTPGRYRFHDLLRLYARERVGAGDDDRDRDGALQRMLEWYVDTSRGADRAITPPGHRLLPCDEAGEQLQPLFATHAEALAWFEAERANLLGAAHQAAEHELRPIAWRLAEALWHFFDLRSHWADCEEIFQIGLAAARAANDRRAEASMLNGLGPAYRELRRFEEAINCHQQALSIYQEGADRHGEASTLANLGIIYNCLNRFEEAIDCFQRDLVILHDLGKGYGNGWTLGNLGIAYQGLRRFGDAIECFQRALEILRDVGDRKGEGRALGSLGSIYADLCKYDEATDFYRQALPILRDVGDRQGESWSLHGLGYVYADLRQYDAAIECFHQALAMRRVTGDREGEGSTLHRLGLAFQQTRDAEAARSCWKGAFAIFAELGVPEADEVRRYLEYETNPSALQSDGS